MNALCTGTFLEKDNRERSFYMRVNAIYGTAQRSRCSDSLGVGQSEDRIPVGANLPHLSRPAPRPSQSPIQWVRGSFLREKWPGRGVDYPTPI